MYISTTPKNAHSYAALVIDREALYNGITFIVNDCPRLVDILTNKKLSRIHAFNG